MFKYTLATLVVVSLTCASWSPADAQGPLGVKTSSGVKTKDANKTRMEANYHFNQAESFREKKQYREAIVEYEKAIKAYPNDPGFYKNLGGTYALSGKLTEAETTLKKGVKIAPKDWLMWNNLAVVLKEEKKNQECIAALKQALAANPPQGYVEEINKTLKDLQGSGLKTSSK